MLCAKKMTEQKFVERVNCMEMQKKTKEGATHSLLYNFFAKESVGYVQTSIIFKMSLLKHYCTISKAG